MGNDIKDITFKNSVGEAVGGFKGDGANLWLGGNKSEGDIALWDAEGEQTVHLDGGDANLVLGGGGHNGDIGLMSADRKLRIHIDGGAGNIALGGEGCEGDIALKDENGKQTIHLDGGEGVITVNGKSIPTADHVFAPNYSLAPLDAVSAHIAANGHLPGVPSAKEMQRDGVNLISMNATLLEKIEELTLYILDQEKRIAALETKS